MTNLYRAIFQRPDGTLRKMTFSDDTPEQAQRTAEQWTVGDKLLTVRFQRALQAPLLVLT